MKRTLAIASLAAVLGILPFAPGVLGQGQGFATLLDGSSLKGWSQVGTANWKVADGVVEATSGNGFLVSAASYGDFQLRVEFWVDDDANSGVFIRCQNTAQIGSDNAYEINIFDKRPDPAYRTGAIVDVAKPSSMINAGGKWNTLEITAQGPRLTVTLNGTRTVDTQHSAHARGPIALQYGAGIVRFRSVQIRTL
jgi:hypothetical protein